MNGGQGVQTVSLRGLGAERTLVLLNGRRAGPALQRLGGEAVIGGDDDDRLLCNIVLVALFDT
mgnify:CR=1 FL=1